MLKFKCLIEQITNSPRKNSAVKYRLCISVHEMWKGKYDPTCCFYKETYHASKIAARREAVVFTKMWPHYAAYFQWQYGHEELKVQQISIIENFELTVQE